MDTRSLEKHFARMGARLAVQEGAAAVALDVRSDRAGEFFEVRVPSAAAADLVPVNVVPKDRHLLLLLKQDGRASKFLCGHDERHWFVAAVPESAGGVGTVKAAMDALKPAAVHNAQRRAKVKAGRRYRRKNAASVRQGEWFFLPEPGFTADPRQVRRDEPLSRGGGSKSHMLEFCYRTGGELVYICPAHPNGLTESQFRKLVARQPAAAKWMWRQMRRNPAVYARGRVRHADHATITLHGWHQVLMNTENQAAAMRHVAFLD